MLRIYKTENGKITTVDKISENAWVCLIDPDAEEISYIVQECSIDADDIRAALDEEEASRIEMGDGYTMLIVDVPAREVRNKNNAYTTIPLSIILKENYILTVCTEDTFVLKPFIEGRMKEFSTAKRTRFIYQILYNNTSLYLNYLRRIDKSRNVIESRLHESTQNEDLIELHELESDLVYFMTSLRGNSVVLEKLTRYERIKQYPEDKELLNDVIIENQQAIEMANVYRDIINGTRELFASVIDNTLNSVMKILTSITIIMAVPTIISGLYGMNVASEGIPFAANEFGFAIVCFITLIVSTIVAILLKKKGML